jgi:hypothetical protein
LYYKSLQINNKNKNKNNKNSHYILPPISAVVFSLPGDKNATATETLNDKKFLVDTLKCPESGRLIMNFFISKNRAKNVEAF